MKLETLIKELETAKKNCYRLLEHPEGLVDMHGLEYRAGKVERLREQIKKAL